MSVNRSNEWKVGAFVVGGVVVAVATLFWLGANRFNSETIERVTFLDESVQGLEVGAPVKVRGVTIGKVTDIRLAQDRRLVEVHASLRVEAMRSLNVLDSDQQAGDELPEVPMDLRFTMASQGITGIKFLEADFFPESAPMIEVPFDPPPGFVPATPSTLKGLEDALRGLAEDVPKALADFRRLTATVDRKLNDLDVERLSTSISSAAEGLSVTLDRADPTKLMGETEALVQELRAFVGDLDGALTRFTGAEGVVEQSASARRDGNVARAPRRGRLLDGGSLGWRRLRLLRLGGRGRARCRLGAGPIGVRVHEAGVDVALADPRVGPVDAIGRGPAQQVLLDAFAANRNGRWRV